MQLAYGNDNPYTLQRATQNAHRVRIHQRAHPQCLLLSTHSTNQVPFIPSEKTPKQGREWITMSAFRISVSYSDHNSPLEIAISKEEESTRKALELLDESDLTIPWFHVEKKKPTQRYKREMRQNRNWLKASLLSSTPSFILNLAHFSYPCIIPCSWSSVLLSGMTATHILPWWSVPTSWMPFL